MANFKDFPSSSVEVIMILYTEFLPLNPSWVPSNFHVVQTVLQPRNPYLALGHEFPGRAVTQEDCSQSGPQIRHLASYQCHSGKASTCDIGKLCSQQAWTLTKVPGTAPLSSCQLRDLCGWPRTRWGLGVLV